jgi:hypothetical protein
VGPRTSVKGGGEEKKYLPVQGIEHGTEGSSRGLLLCDASTLQSVTTPKDLHMTINETHHRNVPSAVLICVSDGNCH